MSPTLVFILSVPILGIILITILWYKKFTHAFEGMKHIRGPFCLPIVGNATRLGSSTEIFWRFYHWFDEFGPITRGVFGFMMLIGITEPEYVEFVCNSTKTIQKGVNYTYLEKWLSRGLLTSSGEKWRLRRKMITPAYHFQILAQFVDVFEKNGNVLIEKLKNQVGVASFDVMPYISRCALDSISETAMGTVINAQDKQLTDYVNATKEMTRIIVERSVKITKHFDFFYQFTEDYKIEQKSVQILHNYTLSVIESRRKELLKNPEQDINSEDEFGRKKRIAFLDLLLRATIDGQPLSKEDIREEVDTFMFEGHDTVSTTMCFWLYLISKHPEVQRKLLEEQMSVFRHNLTKEVTYSDLQSMPYMEMTIKETLRLYPSVPLLIREAVEDVSFKDLKIKKGTQILMFPFYMHRRKELYPDPERFIPERFSSTEQRKRHPFAYLGFSAGFRNCIGQRFAMLEMKSTLSKILRHYEICRSFPEHEVILKSEIILASGNGYKIQLRTRV